MESALEHGYMREKNPTGVCDPDELLGDMHTTLGTAKWQVISISYQFLEEKIGSYCRIRGYLLLYVL